MMSLRCMRRIPSPAPLMARNRFLSTSRSLRSEAEPKLSAGEQAIHDKLRAKFNPVNLEVQDVSGGCGSFYAISIASASFAGLSTLKQHRLVTKTLKDEIEGIHGLQLKTTSLEE